MKKSMLMALAVALMATPAFAGISGTHGSEINYQDKKYVGESAVLFGEMASLADEVMLAENDIANLAPSLKQARFSPDYVKPTKGGKEYKSKSTQALYREGLKAKLAATEGNLNRLATLIDMVNGKTTTLGKRIWTMKTKRNQELASDLVAISNLVDKAGSSIAASAASMQKTSYASGRLRKEINAVVKAADQVKYSGHKLWRQVATNIKGYSH